MKERLSKNLQTNGEEENALAKICAALPRLPSAIRYYDDFDDTVRSILNPEEKEYFDLKVAGRPCCLNFERLGTHCEQIFKHVFAFIISKDLSINTAFNYLSMAQHLKPDEIEALIKAGPTGVGPIWIALRARALPSGSYMAAKYILTLLCAYRLNGWSSEYLTYLSTTLPLPFHDKYAVVRTGDAFLSVDEEALIVRYLDSSIENLRQGRLQPNDLVDAGMLLCAYQFAMRPIQIAMLGVRHVRIWNDEFSDYPTVHLTFHMAKQRGSGKRAVMTRRVKQEWTGIFVQWKTHIDRENIAGSEKFFQVKSSNEVSRRIAALVRKLLNSDDIGTAMDLRHTAAQRLVDAGANHEELAEFLGHAQTNTGLVYYATSASHAERINRALGASTVYQRFAKIAHDRFISREELMQLKGDQYVAAVPHGIPISGIGGCTSGQPSCPYNPVTSCYGCRKFMPIHDKSLHENVLAEMREVVLLFDRSSHNDTRSPAYLQLQRTISEIQAVISEIEETTE